MIVHARLVAPHVLTPVDLATIAAGGTLTAGHHRDRYTVLDNLVFLCDDHGVQVLSSVNGPGTATWDDLTAIIRAGLDGANVAAAEAAHTAHRAAVAALDNHTTVHPWNPRAGGQDPTVAVRAAQLAGWVTATYRAWTRTVAELVDTGLNSGRIDLDLETWLALRLDGTQS